VFEVAFVRLELTIDVVDVSGLAFVVQDLRVVRVINVHSSNMSRMDWGCWDFLGLSSQARDLRPRYQEFISAGTEMGTVEKQRKTNLEGFQPVTSD